MTEFIFFMSPKIEVIELLYIKLIILNSLRGTGVLYDVKLVYGARRNCVESVSRNFMPPGFDSQKGHHNQRYVQR